MKPITVVIPSYKKPEQLEKCKKALDKQTYDHVKPFIWDNNTHNIGFTKAMNKGLKLAAYSEGDYVILLNQDCYLKPNSVTKMVEFMDKNPKCAIGGIKQISDKNPDYIVHGGCQEAFPSGIHKVGSIANGDCSINKMMPWVNGACLIVRLDAVLDIGLMDENFFLICSDSDWCYTARARHWEVWYIADAECIHEQGISNKPTPEFEQIMVDDMVYFKDKWCESGLFRELHLETFE